MHRADGGPSSSPPRPVRLLYASAELYPLVKTGGLADVSAALPAALQGAGVDVTVVLPAYRSALRNAGPLRKIGAVEVLGRRVALLGGRHPDSGVPLILIDAPDLYDREGDPYHDVEGRPFEDNAIRFGLFSLAVAALAEGGLDGSAFEIAHLNDWQTGLAAPSLARSGIPSVFTIHNLAYQGSFGPDAVKALASDPGVRRQDSMEDQGGISFIRTALRHSDEITTVSPTYAREIMTPEFGEGLHDLLGERAGVLSGIVNGIDDRTWDPSRDPLIARRYDATSVGEGKQVCRRHLRNELGLPDSPMPILAFIGRLAHQKGADALLAAADELSTLPVQIVVLATGDRDLERGFAHWADRHPDRIKVRLTHDEPLAHRIAAGADMLIMPSRFEPCGLCQLFGQRYGTIPLVRRIGGLSDTVDDAGTSGGTGIRFENSDRGGVIYAVRRALDLFQQPDVWTGMQVRGMTRDFSWRAPVREYLAIYARLSSRSTGGGSAAFRSAAGRR